MIDHTAVNVKNYGASRDFYRAALLPLGYDVVMDFTDSAGFGADGNADFWIEKGEPQVPRVHVAFRADNREAVDRFYRAALDAGGKDNGAPGPRPDYGTDYYAAYVLDPDGYNVEAVCHRPL